MVTITYVIPYGGQLPDRLLVYSVCFCSQESRLYHRISIFSNFLQWRIKISKFSFINNQFFNFSSIYTQAFKIFLNKSLNADAQSAPKKLLSTSFRQPVAFFGALVCCPLLLASLPSPLTTLAPLFLNNKDWGSVLNPQEVQNLLENMRFAVYGFPIWT